MKRLILLLLCFTLLVSGGFSVEAAYKYPSGFWNINGKYEQALNQKNYSDVIKYGKQIIKMFEGVADSSEKRNILVTRYNEVGNAYAVLGDYETSAEFYRKLYDYAGEYEGFYDYTRGAKAKADQYTPVISLYTDKGEFTYYGGKNEKENGVLFGLCANGETRRKLGNESLLLTYQELGQELLSYNEGILKTASSTDCAVEFALNCPNEANDIKKIKRMESYLKDVSKLFEKYPKVPVYLRFAAEFDVWTNIPQPDEFVEAFRYVSDYFKTRNKNVAVVWSPNQVSSWNVNVNDYYPGDEYVDWVGMSLYSQKYFMGDKNQSEQNAVVFKTGVGSDPVIAVKDIVEEYGDRKPIMISESGCGHKLVKSGENLSDFALNRLRQMYVYLPMVYPQIKGMAYFDWYVKAEGERYDFRLSTNTALQNEYLHRIKGPRFIQDGYSEKSDFSYRKFYNGIGVDSIFEVSCYAHLYGTEPERVTYFIDGNYAGLSEEMPFTAVLDTSGYSGSHSLKAVAVFENGKTLTDEYKINIYDKNEKIKVEISDKRVDFDRDPVLYNDRTMVPMRKIFEQLGAKVTWDEKTQTATGKKGDRTVKISVGQRVMTVNSKVVKLDAAPIVISDRTLVPVRAVAEGLGCEVDWDGGSNTVSITPKVFRWSDWEEELPKGIDADMYYIEKRKEYKYRTREKEYYTLDYELASSRYLVDKEITYGEWSGWSENYVAETDTREVEEKRIYEPKRYYYAHYCTGNISDKEYRYRTAFFDFHDQCKYHELGWFDTPLNHSEDSNESYTYYVNGKEYVCSNECFRWYLMDTEEESYKLYRYRTVSKKFTYWEWGDWSRWSKWDDEDPEDYEPWDEDDDYDIDSRKVYRYKEKG